MSVSKQDAELACISSYTVEEPDMSDIRGLTLPRRAVEVMITGGHNLLLQGPPGVGKTMLALPAVPIHVMADLVVQQVFDEEASQAGLRESYAPALILLEQDCKNMAVLVDIERLTEDEARADYIFTVGEATQPGVLRIKKATGEVTLGRAMEGVPNADAHFHRAAHQIKQHWKRGKLPETAVWAS